MRKFKMTISYDGTNYSGWQIQPNALSIQECIENAAKTLFKEEVRVIGAGRTDAGVHALGQAAHFAVETSLSLHQLKYNLNGLLPHDIRIKEMFYASPDFHAQISARSKVYHYHLWLDPIIDPFVRLYRHRPKGKIDTALLNEAAALFVGTKDFTTFANVGSNARHAVRTLYRLDVVEQEGGYRLEFEGDGFLYKMVRNISGTILQVASGKRELQEIPTLLRAKDRRLAPPGAPALGLFLVRVDYPEHFFAEEL